MMQSKRLLRWGKTVFSPCLSALLVSEALSICIVKLVSPCNAEVAFVLSELAVRGPIPAHHGNVIFFYLAELIK